MSLEAALQNTILHLRMPVRQYKFGRKERDDLASALEALLNFQTQQQGQLPVEPKEAAVVAADVGPVTEGGKEEQKGQEQVALEQPTTSQEAEVPAPAPKNEFDDTEFVFVSH